MTPQVLEKAHSDSQIAEASTPSLPELLTRGWPDRDRVRPPLMSALRSYGVLFRRRDHLVSPSLPASETFATSDCLVRRVAGARGQRGGLGMAEGKKAQLADLQKQVSGKA